MTNTVTVRPTRGVRGIGMLSIIAGIVLLLAGIGTWIAVSSQLSAEDITVSDDADMLAGRQVNGPLTAYAQADVIAKHAEEIGGGKTYAELPQDDPNRAIVMNASFLRASLYTSVVAFGVAALVVGLGIIFILFGIALRKLAGGPTISLEGPGLTSGGDLSDAAHRTPAHAAPAQPEPSSPGPPPRATEPGTPGASPAYPGGTSAAAPAPAMPGPGGAPSGTPPTTPQTSDTGFRPPANTEGTGPSWQPPTAPEGDLPSRRERRRADEEGGS